MNYLETSDLLWGVIMDIMQYPRTMTPPAVRQSWQMHGGPDFKITDNVIFLQLMYESGNDVSRPLHTFESDSGDDIQVTKTQTRVLRLRLIAYGDNGSEDIYKIRTAIYGGLKVLRQNGIYVIPSDDEPRYSPELFGGQWWPRTEFDFLFNQYAEYKNTVTTIEQVPVTVNLNNEASVISDAFIVVKENS